MFLFLLGLLTGFVETKFANPRMGLAAHLEGVMNGTFLIALGAVWMEVRLTAKLKAAAYWLALYGAYVNWATTALGAALGAAALSPITGAGHNALPWQETLMTALFMSVGLAIVGSSVLVLWGLRRGAEKQNLPRINTDKRGSEKAKPLTTKDTKEHKGRSEKQNPHYG